MVHIYNGILLSHKKEWNWVICKDVDGTRDTQTKWNRSERKKIKYQHIYVESEKIGIDELIFKAEIETWS